MRLPWVIKLQDIAQWYTDRAHTVDDVVVEFRKKTAWAREMILKIGEKLYVPYLLTIYGIVTQESNGEGLSGFPMTLRDSTGKFIDRTETGLLPDHPSGYYEFSGLLPIEYLVNWSIVDRADLTTRRRNFVLVTVLVPVP